MRNGEVRRGGRRGPRPADSCKLCDGVWPCVVLRGFFEDSRNEIPRYGGGVEVVFVFKSGVS